MGLKIIKGDLIELAKKGEFDFIMHGANCKGIMGAGIAAKIAEEFPEAFIEDQRTLKLVSSLYKLGGFSSCYIKRYSLRVVNLYTQNLPGANFVPAALDLALHKFYTEESNINHPAEVATYRIGVPWIGCGIGGGNQLDVELIFQRYSKVLNLTVVELE